MLPLTQLNVGSFLLLLLILELFGFHGPHCADCLAHATAFRVPFFPDHLAQGHVCRLGSVLAELSQLTSSSWYFLAVVVPFHLFRQVLLMLVELAFDASQSTITFLGQHVNAIKQRVEVLRGLKASST